MISQVSAVYFDDADAYVTWEKIRQFICDSTQSAKMVFAMRITNHNTFEEMRKWCEQMKRVVLNEDAMFNKNIEQYAITLPTDQPVAKLHLLHHLCNKFKSVCPLAQMVIFCNVSILFIYKCS